MTVSGVSGSLSSSIVSAHAESGDARPPLYSDSSAAWRPDAASLSAKLLRCGRSWYSSASRAYEASWELLSRTPCDEYWGVSALVSGGACKMGWKS
jgi:hypothetical protein